MTPGWFALAMVVGMVASLLIGMSIGYRTGRRVGQIVERHRHEKKEATRDQV